MKLIQYIITCIIILLLYSCFSSMLPTTSYEFNSARAYARIEDNLVEAEKWALEAMKAEPDNSQVPWFLANEVYRPQKKKDKVAEMFKEALKRDDSELEEPFIVGDQEIMTVHGAIKSEASSIHNDGVKLLNRGKKNKAMSKFIFSMNLNPGLIANYLILSDLAHERNDSKEAMEYLDEASKIDKNNIDLIFRKSKYARLNKNFNVAISSLQSVNTKDNNLKLMIDREIFMIYIDMEDYLQAIVHGSTLVENMLEDVDIEDLVLSEACYNLAICNRYIGYELYNSVVEVVNSATDNKETIRKAIENAGESIEYFSFAKERFFDAGSFNPDDKTSTNNAKELNKIIKQLKRLFIPSLEETLLKNDSN